MANAFFGVQLAIDAPPDAPLRRTLGALVREFRAATGFAAQRAVWTRASAVLGGAIGGAVYGTWDLVRDRGDAEYEDWASGLEAMALWTREDFGVDGRYALVSCIALVEGGSNADRALGDLCDVPRAAWQRRETYRRLVAAPPLMNFTNVVGSGLYLAPGEGEPGFSDAVLTGEGFDYLARVV